jgi:four helix bundle protein
MAKYQHFEELPAWQTAANLYNTVLDLLARREAQLSPTFRNQLERAALSVSNNIAEGFERLTTAELLSFLGIARGSAGEVQSMLLVVRNRPVLKPVLTGLQEIVDLAKSCQRQLTAWITSIENGPIQGKRHLTARLKQAQKVETAAREFRLNWLRTLKPQHPLFNSPEARQARGEPIEE